MDAPKSHRAFSNIYSTTITKGIANAHGSFYFNGNFFLRTTNTAFLMLTVSTCLSLSNLFMVHSSFKIFVYLGTCLIALIKGMLTKRL